MIHSFRIIIFALICFSVIGISNAQSSKIYKGTIGKYPIILKMDLEFEYAESAYYYESILKDIRLNSLKHQDSIILYHGIDADNFDERFVLKQNADGDWVGNWRKDKQVHKVWLTPIESFNIELKEDRQFLSKENLNYYGELTAYDVYKFNQLSFVQDSIVKFGDWDIIWCTEKKSKISFFRLMNDYSKINLNRINQILLINHYSEAFSYLNCSSSFGEGDYDFYSEVTYLNNDILSFKMINHYYCGGAHPDGGVFGKTFNMLTGKEYEFNEIISFDGQTIKCIDGDCMDWYDYLENVQGKNVVKLLSNENYINLENDSEDDYCQLSNPEYWSFLKYFLTNEGVVVIPSLPRVARSCEEEYLIPYSKIEKYYNPSFKNKIK